MSNENDLNSRVGLDTTNFKTGANELKEDIRAIENSFRASAATMEGWSNTSLGLSNRVESLSEKLALQKKQLTLLASEYDKTVKSEGAGSKSATSLANQMYNLEKQISSTEKDLNTYNDKLKVVNGSQEENTSSAKKMEAAFVGLGNQSKTTTTDIGAHFNALKAAIAGSGVALGIKSLTDKILDFAETGSDLGEAQNVVEQTFKTSSKAVIEWTKTMDDAAGISQTNATTFVGSMGAMLKSSGVAENSAASMSETLVQLTGDMSSFYNVGTSDMWEKIRSGISGETEPLKQLGINMSVANLQAFALSEGLKKPYNEMSQSEQTVLRYNYLLSVTKDAQGDFTRTLDDSNANLRRVFELNMEEMKSSIGQGFLPVVNEAYKQASPFVKSLIPELASGAKALSNEVLSHKTDILNFIRNTIDGAKQGYKFVVSNGDTIIKVLKSAAIGLVAWKSALILANAAGAVYNTVQGIMTIKAGITAVAKGVETTATVAETSAQWGLNAALAANPFGAVAVAVGALAAGIAFLCNRTDEATDAENKQLKSINDECQAWEDLKKSTYDQASSDLAEIDRAEKMLDWLNKNTDATGKLTGSKTEAAKAVDIINKTTGKDELKLNGDMVQGLQDQKKAIDELIKSKKAKILLDANEGNYKAALTDRTKVEDEQGALGRQIKDNKAKLKNINDQREAMRANNTLNADMAIKFDNQSDLIETSLNSEIEAFNKNEKRLSEYYENIHNYETASAEFTQGHYDTVNDIYNTANLNFKAAGDATEEELRRQFDDLSETASQMEARWKSGDKNITESMVTEAKDRAQKAYDEYINFGVSAGDGIKSGTDSAKSDVKSAGKSMGDTFKSGINSSDPKEIGKNYANNVLAGFVQSMRAAEEELTSSSTTPKGSIFTSYNNYKAGHNAQGTDNWRGGLTWVGERGPELLNLPRGSQIIPHGESLRIGSLLSRAAGAFSGGNAQAPIQKSTNYNFYQTNNSPKALSDAEIARNTRNSLQQICLQGG